MRSIWIWGAPRTRIDAAIDHLGAVIEKVRDTMLAAMRVEGQDTATADRHRAHPPFGR